MTNMAIEAGAQNAIIAPDAKTFAYVDRVAKRPYEAVCGDPDAEISEEIVIDIDALEPVVAAPLLPSNTTSWRDVTGLRLDQVYIGSCTNCCMHDLREEAGILKGSTVDDGQRVLLIPRHSPIN